jgi:hypothetical protein
MLTYDAVIDIFNQFPVNDKIELLDILKKRQSQEWRRDTAEYYNSIKDSVKAGEFESMSAEEAIKDLHNSLSTTD